MMDFFIDENFKYSHYKDKSVLIVGGGPSTSEVKWESIDVDYIWSCTNFFMNPNLTNKNIDLVSLGNLQNYNDSRLLNYLDYNIQTKVLFENNYLYPQTLTKNSDFLYKYRGRIFYGETAKSYTGIVGPPARLLILAASLGFKDIYFVGIDGFDKNLKNTHSFTDEAGLREGATHNKYEKYYNDHTEFAKKLYENFGNRVKFRNLGEAAVSHNIISFVSKQLFPLDESILNQIK